MRTYGKPDAALLRRNMHMARLANEASSSTALIFPENPKCKPSPKNRQERGAYLSALIAPIVSARSGGVLNKFLTRDILLAE